jgi:hypothetical protein
VSEKSAAERQAPLQATRKLPIAEVGLLIFQATRPPPHPSKIINKKSSILIECFHLPMITALQARIREGHRRSTIQRGVAAASPPSHPLPFFKAICPSNRLTEKEVEGLWLKDEGRNPFILQTSPVPPPV